MKAILKEIEVYAYNDSMLTHRIKMVFTESLDSDELYYFGTSIEQQFCTKEELNQLYTEDEFENNSPKELIEAKIKYAKSFIGKTFNINLHKFSVKELTYNKYVAFEYCPEYGDSKTITDYHIASYMTREDVLLNYEYIVTKQGIDRTLKGVLPDKSTEEITTELFFPRPIPEKKSYKIPYEKYPAINANFVINEASIDEIRTGHYLANQLKERNVYDYEFDQYINQIEEYRADVKAAKIANASLRKKLFFWEPKECVKELEFSPDIVSMMIDSIILCRLYPNDCEIARKDYVAECERRLRKKFMHEDAYEAEFKNEMQEFKIALAKKYRGKTIIKVIEN